MGAEVDKACKDGDTPLHKACLLGHTECAKLLSAGKRIFSGLMQGAAGVGQAVGGLDAILPAATRLEVMAQELADTLAGLAGLAVSPAGAPAASARL